VTRVGFYVVQAADQAQRLQVAVRLADKAFQQGHRIFINAVDEAQARFLPHALHDQEQSEAIAIGWGQEPRDHNDLLINLQLGIPGFFSRFRRVAEVVTQDPASLDALRRSWTFYKERGYQLEKHDL
jgi:DNA polymerase-3 subunit chi